MHFRPREAGMIDGRSAVELWDHDRHVATIYAQRAGVHIVYQTGFGPGELAVEVQQPYGVIVPAIAA